MVRVKYVAPRSPSSRPSHTPSAFGRALATTTLSGCEWAAIHSDDLLDRMLFAYFSTPSSPCPSLPTMTAPLPGEFDVYYGLEAIFRHEANLKRAATIQWALWAAVERGEVLTPEGRYRAFETPCFPEELRKFRERMAAFLPQYAAYSTQQQPRIELQQLQQPQPLPVLDLDMDLEQPAAGGDPYAASLDEADSFTGWSRLPSAPRGYSDELEEETLEEPDSIPLNDPLPGPYSRPSAPVDRQVAPIVRRPQKASAHRPMLPVVVHRQLQLHQKAQQQHAVVVRPGQRVALQQQQRQQQPRKQVAQQKPLMTAELKKLHDTKLCGSDSWMKKEALKKRREEWKAEKENGQQLQPLPPVGRHPKAEGSVGAVLKKMHQQQQQLYPAPITKDPRAEGTLPAILKKQAFKRPAAATVHEQQAILQRQAPPTKVARLDPAAAAASAAAAAARRALANDHNKSTSSLSGQWRQQHAFQPSGGGVRKALLQQSQLQTAKVMLAPPTPAAAAGRTGQQSLLRSAASASGASSAARVARPAGGICGGASTSRRVVPAIKHTQPSILRRATTSAAAAARDASALTDERLESFDSDAPVTRLPSMEEAFGSGSRQQHPSYVYNTPPPEESGGCPQKEVEEHRGDTSPEM